MTLQEILADIHALEKELLYFEQKYGLLSETLYAAYMSGEEPEDDEWVADFGEWASIYRTCLEREAQYREEMTRLQTNPPSILGLVQERKYQPLIELIISEHLKSIPNQSDIETFAVIDEKSQNYLLMDMGWQKPRRIHSVIFHLRIRDGKIWIEQDWTEGGVARDLLKAGVPPRDIILGFQPPDMRPYAQELLTVP